MAVRVYVFMLVLFLCPLRALAQPAPNVVTQWAAIVQQSIHNATAPRSAGTSEVLHTMVHLAVYDAVAAIEGGHSPYRTSATSEPDRFADVNAAVATAAYLTARARVAPSQSVYLDQEYANFMATVPGGPAKDAGVQVGTRSAASLISARVDDGFNNVVLYQCSEIPPPIGEFTPETGCPTAATSPQPVDARLGRIKPFSFTNPSEFRPRRPRPLTSGIYTADFIETRDLGRADSLVRTPEQTDVAFFWSENPYVHWNRNLTSLAISQALDVRETALMFAMVHTSVSDAIIIGFEAKYGHAFWRPRTAIPQADADGNHHTEADPSWRPLLSVNHPEYPSGHGFWSTALIDALSAFFGTDELTWTIVTSKVAVPKVEQTARTYSNLEDLKREIFNARVWGGLHWRFSIDAGEQIGERVARHVTRFFHARK